MSDNKKLRVMCKRDLVYGGDKKNINYKSVAYNIPIAKDGESYITGQNLTLKKMLGTDSLTPDEQIKYPFVINPEKMYKIKHLTWLGRDDAYQNTIIDLLLISGKWAKDKLEYDNDTVKYDGYFEDPIAEAVAINYFKDDRFDAETCIRGASIEDYQKIALMVNFLSPDVAINVSMNRDLVLKQLYDVCDTKPLIVKSCFAKYNKGVDKDIFILECLHYNILRRIDNGDIWYLQDYIGKTLDDVKRYLGKKENEHLWGKFQALLEQSKGHTVTNMQITEKISGIEQNMIHIMECKAAIFDGDYEKAKTCHSKINRELYPIECETLSEQLKKMEEKRSESKSNAVKEKFIADLQLKDIKDLQKTIVNKVSKYKEEDCKEFWDDKEKLIVYMSDFKFGK